MRNKTNWNLIIGVFFVVFMFWAGLTFTSGLDRMRKDFQKEDETAYSAWIKYTHRTDITFEEWRAMRNAHTLPNTQNDK